MKKNEAANFIDNMYIMGRMFRNAEKKPRYYGTNMLLYPNEAYTLKAIVENEGIHQKELTALMFRTKGATSVVIKKLLQKGLVLCKSESEDLRVGSLYPTEMGKKVYHAHREYDKRYIDLISEELDIPNEDLARMNELIVTITEFMTERMEKKIQF